ncbi:LytTR family transcriptional regulator DNA-binding domain-containing protein [Spirosoma harenae]
MYLFKSKQFILLALLQQLTGKLAFYVLIIWRSYMVNRNYIAEVETYINGEYLVKVKTAQQLRWIRNYRENRKAFYANSI